MHILFRLLGLLAFTFSASGQHLVVKLGNEKPVLLTMKDLELLPHQSVKARDHAGKEAEWSGVPLYQVLQKAGLNFGDSLRGPALAQYVLVTAADGYRIVLALPELDPRCTDDPVLLCESVDGGPISSEQGPLRLVLPKERRHFRWVRQVVRVEVRSVAVP